MNKRIALFLTLLFNTFLVQADDIWIVPLNGAIGPATSDYVSREIRAANEQGAEMVILKMDTPGGLDAAMRDIIREITSSPIPVATWVGPSGARAASAGTYILLASHIAAMAEATNLGAATPVSIGGGSSPPPTDGEKSQEDQNQKGDESDTESSESTQQDPDKVPSSTALEKKAVNDARAYIRGLARLHNRNADWAEKAVSEAASLDATDAKSLGVIDFIANSVEELVAKTEGKTINLNGKQTLVFIENVRWVEREPDWRAEFLSVLTNPNVAYILMMIGIYGLLLEFYSPGVGLAGVLGGISLLLGMYALQMLPLNYAGLGLIILGIALMVSEAFSPSFGIFGLGGITAFVFGSVFLFDSNVEGYQIAFPIIAGVTVFSLVITVVLLSMLLTTRRKEVVTGIETMIGKSAQVLDNFSQGQGEVQLGGERWRAISDTELERGQDVVVEQVNGLTLRVKPLDSHR
ncbi:NfeD family protein [Veronia pacifica]|uniref:Serine protease n=1 Tax=Veronia pacifica TaxID=1080227 RepID=A0A1C3EIC7_9GAMM|nr:nodulation protein NfeD [Veronia pacifica]ODA32978.1 serine protease [Veronia pacifica]